MNLPLIILAVLLIWTWARLFRPVHKAVEGNSLRIASLPLLAKIRMHVVPSAAALTLAIIEAVSGAISPWVILVPVVSTVMLLVIPVRYTITDQGIRLGWTRFRRWTEFAGVRRTRFGARMLGVNRTRGMNIWLSGSRDDDEFLHFLRQTQKNAYKGQFGVVSGTDLNQSVNGMSHIESRSQQIAAFSNIDSI